MRENLDSEIRVTVIAAGFDRYEEQMRESSGVNELFSSSVRPVITLDEPQEEEKTTIDLFDADEDDLDDEFDVPSFLK